MEVENINYLYQTEELEWHHWEGLGTDASLSEPVVKKKMDLKSYQAYCLTLENKNQPKAGAQIIVKIQNDLK